MHTCQGTQTCGRGEPASLLCQWHEADVSLPGESPRAGRGQYCPWLQVAGGSAPLFRLSEPGSSGQPSPLPVQGWGKAEWCNTRGSPRGRSCPQATRGLSWGPKQGWGEVQHQLPQRPAQPCLRPSRPLGTGVERSLELERPTLPPGEGSEPRPLWAPGGAAAPCSDPR